MTGLNLFTDCKNCELSKTRRNIVMGKGMNPADICFIIDSPSKTDDLKGYIFTGLYGKFLDRLILDAWKLSGCEGNIPRLYYTSLIGCRPCDRFGGENREPKSGEILACLKRLEKIVSIVKPKVYVFMGKIVTQYLKKRFPEHFEIFHPQYLLSGGGISHPDYLFATRKLSEAFTYNYNERNN